MSKYLTAVKISFNQKLEQRFNILIGTLARLLFFFTIGALWLKIYQQKSSINGLNLEYMISYTLLATMVASLADTNTGKQVYREVKEGKISRFLIKPLDFINYYIASSLGTFLFEIFVASLIFICLLNLYPHTTFYYQYFRIPGFFLSLALALIIWTQLYLIVGILAFWIQEAKFLIQVIKRLVKFLAGGYISIALFPVPLQTILKFLPFSSMVYFPTTILVEPNLSISSLGQTLSLQLAWIVILFIFLRYLWRQGVRHYEAIGV